MRRLGLLLILFGVIGLVLAMNMETSVEAKVPEQIGRREHTSRERVHNLDLAAQRSGWLFVSGLQLSMGASPLNPSAGSSDGILATRHRHQEAGRPSYCIHFDYGID